MISAWCRYLLGDDSVVLAILRHGIFDFSDLERCAKFLRTERETRAAGAGGVAQPARNHALRKQTLQPRQAVREARNWRQWQDDGWKLRPSQVQQESNDFEGFHDARFEQLLRHLMAAM